MMLVVVPLSSNMSTHIFPLFAGKMEGIIELMGILSLLGIEGGGGRIFY